MQFSISLSALFLAAIGTSHALPSYGHGHGHEASVTPIYQFPNNGSWVENLAVRPNGLILATRIDVPKLYSIDPEAHTATLVHTFPGPITSLAGITEVKKDVYAIVAFNETASLAGELSTGFIFVADLTKTPPTFKRAATIKKTGLINGMAPVSEDIVLVTDSQVGVLWKVDLTTGASSVASSDVLLTPPGSGPFPSGGFGANGLKIFHDYAYFTAPTRRLFARIPISSDGTAKGPAEIVSHTPTFLDDFVISWEGVAYSATNINDTVIAIKPDGAVTTVAGKNNTLTVAGSTSLAFVPGSKQREAYVGTTGGSYQPVNGVTVEPAKVVKISLPVDYWC